MLFYPKQIFSKLKILFLAYQSIGVIYGDLGTCIHFALLHHYSTLNHRHITLVYILWHIYIHAWSWRYPWSIIHYHLVTHSCCLCQVLWICSISRWQWWRWYICPLFTSFALCKCLDACMYMAGILCHHYPRPISLGTILMLWAELASTATQLVISRISIAVCVHGLKTPSLCVIWSTC